MDGLSGFFGGARRAPDHYVSKTPDVEAALMCRHLEPDVSLADMFGGFGELVTVLMALDGKQHRTARRPMAMPISRQAVSRLGQQLHLMACERLASLGTSFDLVREYARPTMSRFVLEWMGTQDVSPEELERAIGLVFAESSTPRRRQLELRRLVQSVLSEATRPIDGKPTVLQDFAKSFEPDRVLGIAMPLLLIGVEGPAIAAASCAAAPRAWSAPLSDAWIDNAIGSAGIIPYVDRVSRHDVFICGLQVRAGERVRISLNSDEAQEQRSVAFGLGERYCVGAAWVRVCARALLEALRTTYPTGTVAEAAPDPNHLLGGIGILRFRSTSP